MDLFADFKGIIQAGPTVLLFTVIFLFAIFFRLSIGEAMQGALTVEAAFAGLKLVVDFMAQRLGLATRTMITSHI